MTYDVTMKRSALDGRRVAGRHRTHLESGVSRNLLASLGWDLATLAESMNRDSGTEGGLLMIGEMMASQRSSVV